MAWSNIEADMMTFFREVAKGVREDMDSGLTHIISYNYKTLAKGFTKAAEDISGKKESSYKTDFELAVQMIMDPWVASATDLKPGDVFRTTTRRKSAQGSATTIVNLPIPNAKVLKKGSKAGRSCTICIKPAGGSSGSYKPSTLNSFIREEVWKRYNENRRLLGGKGIKYDSKTVGRATPFAHDQQSTVGLKQMGALDDQLQNDQSPQNPFQEADAFIGQLGVAKSISMSAYVAQMVLGSGASTQFTEEMLPNSEGTLVLTRVVRGTFSGRNFPGSELTDKRHFNRYIKEYYQKSFLQYFDARTKKGKATMKAMGYKTAADFRGSSSFRDIKKDELLNKVGTKLSKRSKNVTAKTPKKPKPKKKQKTFKPKNVKKARYSSGKAINVNKKGRAKRRTKSGKPDMRFKENRHSPIALTQLLNKALPEELKKNMTGVYPRSLEWRTGRFAQSAEVRSIVPFPNLTQIQYTYMKDPYEVFEGKGRRDPRQIIGGTIRELAQSIMGDKFGLVRTKRV
jgi:hypothetical protein